MSKDSYRDYFGEATPSIPTTPPARRSKFKWGLLILFTIYVLALPFIAYLVFTGIFSSFLGVLFFFGMTIAIIMDIFLLRWLTS